MEILRILLHWFYCLDLSDVVLLLAAGTVIFCLLEPMLEQWRRWRWVLAGILAALMIAVAFTTIGNRTAGSLYRHLWIPFHSYREAVETGNREIYRSNLMNVALLYPGGLLLVALLPKRWHWRRCVASVLVLAAVSVGIEFVQYRYALGRCEIDDVIHNVLGALLGSLAAQWMLPRMEIWIKGTS